MLECRVQGRLEVVFQAVVIEKGRVTCTASTGTSIRVFFSFRVSLSSALPFFYSRVL